MDNPRKLENFFPKNLKFLREGKKLNIVELGKVIGKGKSTINNYETGVAEPSIENLMALASFFSIDLSSFIGIDLSAKNGTFLSQQNQKVVIKSSNNGSNDSKTKSSLLPFQVNEAQEPYTRTVKIPIMDTYAGASSQGFLTQGYIDEKDTISLPSNMLQNGKKYVCFQVKGESMLPTLQHKDYVIAKFIELNDLKDDKIYAIVTQNQDMIIKRVQNNPNEGILVCYPDNIYHSSIKVRYEDIFQIFEVAARLTIHLDQTPLLENLERLFKSRK